MYINLICICFWKSFKGNFLIFYFIIIPVFDKLNNVCWEFSYIVHRGSARNLTFNFRRTIVLSLFFVKTFLDSILCTTWCSRKFHRRFHLETGFWKFFKLREIARFEKVIKIMHYFYSVLIDFISIFSSLETKHDLKSYNTYCRPWNCVTENKCA